MLNVDLTTLFGNQLYYTKLEFPCSQNFYWKREYTGNSGTQMYWEHKGNFDKLGTVDLWILIECHCQNKTEQHPKISPSPLEFDK